MVVFTPQQPGERLTAWIDSDGDFTLTRANGETLALGDFVISFEQPELPEEMAKTPEAKALLARLRANKQVPAKYQKAETSKLKVTITPETKSLPTFHLK
jgi:hypothetical protein